MTASIGIAASALSPSISPICTWRPRFLRLRTDANDVSVLPNASTDTSTPPPEAARMRSAAPSPPRTGTAPSFSAAASAASETSTP